MISGKTLERGLVAIAAATNTVIANFEATLEVWKRRFGKEDEDRFRFVVNSCIDYLQSFPTVSEFRLLLKGEVFPTNRVRLCDFYHIREEDGKIKIGRAHV